MFTSPSAASPSVEVGKRARLDIRSVRNLEFCLGISRTTLQSSALNADSYYSPFPKPPKVRPFQKKFKPHKLRIIDNPIDPLRTIQKRIQHRLLAAIDLPFYLCGGVRGRRLQDNVAFHLGAPVIVTVDIKNFFPSIHNRQVYEVWTKLLGCSAEIGSLLTRLTTRTHYLPQGASTSTTLANLVLLSIDRPIREACEQNGVRYSTWVDDLAFSGANARKVLPLVIRTLKTAGFDVSRNKIRIMGEGTQKVLNGVLLGTSPSVMPERIKQMRSGIHKLQSGEVPRIARKQYIRQLGASIAQITSISPRKGSLLQTDFDVACKESRAVRSGSDRFAFP
jgi:RNA-directed DNA polymerase